MNWTEANWRAHAKAFPGFLAPFARPMGRSERREGAALYVEGLLLPGEPQSLAKLGASAEVDPTDEWMARLEAGDSGAEA